MSGTPIRACLGTAVMLVLWAGPASAQQSVGRFTISFGAGTQAAMPAFNERFEFQRPVDQAENATADVDYNAKAALLIDGGFAVRLGQNIGVGVSISRYHGDSRGDVTAQIPNPFEFNRPRDVSGSAAGLDHTELGYHVHLHYSRPLRNRLRLVLSAGPTLFDVNRQVVDSIVVDESYPFDTAAFRSATSRTARGRGVGFNAGVDVVWTINRSAGLGALVRYARGTADLDVAARSVTVDAGGVQATGGVRLYF